MAKEIPYFKFYTAEWSNGDITLEDYQCQGVFINVCAYYWSKDCELKLTVLLKRFRGFESQINTLIESGIIKNEGENISISFLNEQMESKEIQKITNQKNGAKGGRPIGFDELYSYYGDIVPNDGDKIEGRHFIYLIHDLVKDEYKIGETSNLKKRRQTIKRPTANLSIHHFKIYDAYKCQNIEREILRRFNHLSISGDWFKLNDNEISEIVSIISQGVNNPNNRQESENKAKNYPFETNIEERKEEERKEKEIRQDISLNFIEDLSFRNLFFRWTKYKKARKEQYKTQDSLETSFKKLIKYSGGELSLATEIIENSIGNNYAGFFELKPTNQNGKQNTNTLKSNNGIVTQKNYGKL